MILLAHLVAATAFHSVHRQRIRCQLWDGLLSSEDEDSAGLPRLGVVATAESDPELMAMLAWAAMSVGLEVTTVPSLSPHSWTIGFSGTGLAHNRVLLSFLSSRLCIRR